VEVLGRSCPLRDREHRKAEGNENASTGSIKLTKGVENPKDSCVENFKSGIGKSSSSGDVREKFRKMWVGN